MDEYVEHYGTPRHSGRYPWGSGKNPQRNKNFLTRAKELKKQGLSEKEIAEAFHLSTTDYRDRYKIAATEAKQDDIRKCVRLKDTGMSFAAISKETGIAESTVRSYLDPVKRTRKASTATVANELEKMLEERPYLDVGEGVNMQLGISEESLRAALMVLEDRGYSVQSFRIQQVTNPGKTTPMRVLGRPGATKKEMFDNREQISSPDGLYFDDYGSIVETRKPVKSISSDRIQIRYAEDGGGDKDGVIELRPGVDDISLGGRNYAQVRIGVDGTHYLKGMAVYNYNQMDPGVDIIFNTSKHKDVPKEKVLKPMQTTETGEINELNPFGTNTRPVKYTDASGEEYQSKVNLVNDDEDWEGWKKTLSSQWLSKQPPQLAKRQLELDYQGRENEFNAIMDIPNPTVKRQLLETFASECDSAAVHMKGAALPRQGNYAILPVTSLSDREVYAPNYDNGEEVVLVRFPHAGTFEMPRLRVNNGNPEAKAVLGTDPKHAIGINPNVARQLSGADFDGDTVLVIPTKNQNRIRAADNVPECLAALKDFDPKESYRKTEDQVKTGAKGEGFHKQKQMGMVSNLINDMQIMGAKPEEVARAVKHSMVVIDAEKHNLDWRQSEIDNGIPELRLKYLGRTNAGASTLISMRKQVDRNALERTPVYSVSKMTDEERARWEAGKEVYREKGGTHIDKKGNVVLNKQRPAPYKVLNVDDVNELSSGYLIEGVYANYANKCKALAERARAALRKTGKLQQNSDAKKQYEEEVKSLNEQLYVASLNAPKERQANLIAGKKIQAIVDTDPSLKEDENKGKLRKYRQRELEAARALVGAHRSPIKITEKEWAAIQAGAISDTNLTQILRYADIGEVRKLATPKTNRGMSTSAKSLARSLLKAGYAPSVVAERIGVSVTTLNKEIPNASELGG